MAWVVVVIFTGSPKDDGTIIGGPAIPKKPRERPDTEAAIMMEATIPIRCIDGAPHRQRNAILYINEHVKYKKESHFGTEQVKQENKQLK